MNDRGFAGEFFSSPNQHVAYNHVDSSFEKDEYSLMLFTLDSHRIQTAEIYHREEKQKYRQEE
jgi:hypothetical protein